MPKKNGMEIARELRKKSESCIWVKTRGTSTKVWIKDIIYAEVFNRKIILHKTDGNLEYYGKMSELEKQVGKPFFRSHRVYLIHGIYQTQI